ncbi:unnamed protein product [Cladocopium goreaui]|uniref:NOL1/NOP2/Sun domain family member 4 n=1 Tax=Cladocopium goreaui TaxID=2562237 RepID=A0A9P1DS63_9DINO|nr:unnamed protein product [Cladocopium goreaui]|mmetsp:Transcript_29248/g.63519  ORF Transcript_29248/g.63519 Transcript_29248/m.63519 type:complete len:376 (+) Transcript_29248:50-1177(+)
MALRREEGWHSSHQSHFGRDRWEELRIALERDHEHLCYVNPFLPASEKEVICEDYSLQPSCIPGAYDFCLPPTERQFPVVDAGDERHIFVDKLREERHELELRAPGEEIAPFALSEGSSLVVSAALQVEEGDTVLDACANGITSLVLAGGLFPRCPRGQALPHDLQGRLVCNEMVKSKASRLQQTMHTLLPWRLFDVNAAAGHAPRVVFTSVDMATTSNAAERLGPYDKILLGPPCTEDKEMLRGSAPGGLSKWSAATAKVNAERQLKWLHNSLWLLREGGVVLYFTRALSVEEGDGVIQRLFQRVEGLFDLQVMPLEELVAGFVPGLSAEPTDWGARIMPDKTSFGPMFFSRLRLLRRRHQGHEQATGFVSLGP